MAKLAEISTTGKFTAGQSMHSPARGETENWYFYTVHCDGVVGHSHKSWDAAIDELTADLDRKRKERASDLRAELAALKGEAA
jgi:hypothetical protein